MNQPNPCGLFTVAALPDRQLYCGPTALSAITGVPATDIERLIIRLRQHEPVPRLERKEPGTVKTMWAKEVALVIQELGYTATEFRGGFLFCDWCSHRRNTSATYLVLVTGHFVAVKGDWIVDSAQSRAPIHLSCSIFNRKRVQRAWRIDRLPETAPAEREAAAAFLKDLGL